MLLRIAGVAALLGSASWAALLTAPVFLSDDGLASATKWLLATTTVSWLVATLLLTVHQARVRRLASWLAAVIPGLGFAVTLVVLPGASGDGALGPFLTFAVGVIGVLIFAGIGLLIGAFSRRALAALAAGIGIALGAIAVGVAFPGPWLQILGLVGFLAVAVAWVPLGIDAYRRGGRSPLEAARRGD